MPVVGRAIDDGVNIVTFEQLAKVLVNLRAAELLRRCFCMLRIHVAHGHDVGELCGFSSIRSPLTAATDQRDVRFIIWPERRPGSRRIQGFLRKPERQAGAGGDDGGGFEERATSQPLWLVLHTLKIPILSPKSSPKEVEIPLDGGVCSQQYVQSLPPHPGPLPWGEGDRRYRSSCDPGRQPCINRDPDS